MQNMQIMQIIQHSLPIIEEMTSDDGDVRMTSQLRYRGDQLVSRRPPWGSVIRHFLVNFGEFRQPFAATKMPGAKKGVWISLP